MRENIQGLIDSLLEGRLSAPIEAKLGIGFVPFVLPLLLSLACALELLGVVPLVDAMSIAALDSTLYSGEDKKATDDTGESVAVEHWWEDVCKEHSSW